MSQDTVQSSNSHLLQVEYVKPQVSGKLQVHHKLNAVHVKGDLTNVTEGTVLYVNEVGTKSELRQTYRCQLLYCI